MTTEVIEKFIEQKDRKDGMINIHFKERPIVTGIFIRSSDYAELKTKNLWRVVSNGKVEEWRKTQNMDLARIFNGIAFTKLTDDKHS